MKSVLNKNQDLPKFSNGNKKLRYDFFKYPKNYFVEWIYLDESKEYYENLLIDYYKPKFNILGKSNELDKELKKK